jgi:hypothetical protein
MADSGHRVGGRISGAVCLACGLLFGEAAIAQQIVNPTVLAPITRDTLPRGTVKATPPQTGEAPQRPAAPGAKTRNGVDWRNAVPVPSVHKHYDPVGDESK